MGGALTAVVLPIALGIIMLGLGLTLTREDFRRVLLYPRAVLVGLVCQMLLLPLVCYGIARGFGLAPAMAVGLMLLSASPGGATANLFSHLSHGDVALNITLTAINSLLSLFTLPLIVGLSLSAFVGREREIPIQFSKVVEVFAIVLVPVVLGMFLRARREALARRLERPVRALSAVFLVLVVVGALLRERAKLAGYFGEVGLPALLFNLASLAVGFCVPLLLKLSPRQATAIGMEIGIHNGTLAIAIAQTVLLDTEMAIPAAIYSLIMFVTAALFGALVNRRNQAAA